MQDMEDALICDGSAASTFTFTFTLESCMLCKSRVVEIQTENSAILMSTAHLCLKTYYNCDSLGEIRPMVVKIYLVPGPKHGLLYLSVKGLSQACFRVIHDEDEEELGVFTVNEKKIDET